jgi:tryptophan synthase alpha chain
VYLTVADPMWSDQPDIVTGISRSGADVLEFGLPTPSARPKGTTIRESFRRAISAEPVDVWQSLARLRAAVPDRAFLLLVYPETVADLGWPELLGRSGDSGVDGLVLTDASTVDIRQVRDAGLGAVPVIRPSTDPVLARDLELAAGRLSYRTIGATTGQRLDSRTLAAQGAAIARTAAVPVLAGFGIRHDHEIRTLAPYVAGVVVGSELIRVIAAAEGPRRADSATQAVRGWKAALR